MLISARKKHNNKKSPTHGAKVQPHPDSLDLGDPKLFSVCFPNKKVEKKMLTFCGKKTRKKQPNSLIHLTNIKKEKRNEKSRKEIKYLWEYLKKKKSPKWPFSRTWNCNWYPKKRLERIKKGLCPTWLFQKGFNSISSNSLEAKISQRMTRNYRAFSVGIGKRATL